MPKLNNFDGYVFLNDNSTFSCADGAVLVSVHLVTYDLLRLIAMMTPEQMAATVIETPSTVLDELGENEEN